jgi:hypothetical protein
MTAAALRKIVTPQLIVGKLRRAGRLSHPAVASAGPPAISGPLEGSLHMRRRNRLIGCSVMGLHLF